MFASLSIVRGPRRPDRPAALARRRDHVGAARRARSRWCWSRSAATTFDGAQEGASRTPIVAVSMDLTDAGLSPIDALRLTNTVFLLGTLPPSRRSSGPASTGCGSSTASAPPRELAQAFAHAFIPIALAYLVAHYFSLVVYLEQAQFTYLLSDPFGDGSDLFGTASSGIDYCARRSDGHLVRAVRRDRGRPRDRPGARPRPGAEALGTRATPPGRRSGCWSR